MLKNFQKTLLIFSFLFSFSDLIAQDLTQYVNPFVGTTGGGNTHPGAQAPWGMVSVCPFNVYFSYDDNEFLGRYSTPYSYGNKYISGFSHVNLSGVGCPDLGAVLLMPTQGKLELSPDNYSSEYKNETASPGFYETELSKYNIKVQTSATQRTGVSRYQFPAGESHILFNMNLALTKKQGGYFKITAPNQIEGMRNTGGFCSRNYINQPVYFVIEFSEDATDFGAWSGKDKYQNYEKALGGDDIGAWFTFSDDKEKMIEARVGISYVSIENAKENLEKENTPFSFDEIKNKAEQEWEKQFSRVQVEGGNELDKKLFYTALYHILIHPNVISDVNGEYPVMDGNGIKKAEGYTRYSIFSLWDTYRNVHPFLSLVYPEVQRDMVQSMVEMYKEAGRLPKWELSGRETFVMVGDPACIVLNDTYQRGIQDFDYKTAYKAMLESATKTENNKIRPFNKYIEEYGFIPVEYKHRGAVSIQQEYALADWNIAQMAKALGDSPNFEVMAERSLNYKNLFNEETGFLRGRTKDGSWVEPFDPLIMRYEDVKKYPQCYVEGNAWQYLFFVPHDIKGLQELLGKKTFAEKLEESMHEEAKFGLWNEPDIAYPFLFNYIKGDEWKTSKYVQKCINKYFADKPKGLPGNDDCGTMSAWLVYAMMGFYPDCPGDMDYTLFQPTFEKITIQLNNDYYEGKEFVVQQKQSNKTQLLWVGKELKTPFVNHHQLTQGGVLEINVEVKE